MIAGSSVLSLLLVAYSTTTNLVPGWDRHYVARNVVVGAGLVAGAVAAGLQPADLGLATTDLGAGWRWGRGAVLAVAVGVAAAAALAPRVPALARLFDDRRADLPPRELGWQVGVRIPVGTAAFEEVAFRGVLLAVLLDATDAPGAITVSSLVFGLWHIGPTIAALRINGVVAAQWRAVAIAVMVTTVGGVVFALLRLVSGSLLAPFLAHWAVNALGLLAAATLHRTRDR